MTSRYEEIIPGYEEFIPSKKQLAFLDWEFGFFFHFGIRTFYEGHQDWDMQPMPLENFLPTQLDCDNWISTAKQAGASYAILVTKHHDGFANWSTKYADYHVGNTPWKNGKGDVVKEFVESCRKYEMKIGLYYSPADFSQKEKQRTPKEYDDYFINQVSELLGNYGRIDYLWFDACGADEKSFDKDRIIKHIRSLQPSILLFNMWDPDTCWKGNEAGILPYPGYITNLATLHPPASEEPEYRWLPAECDCMIRNNAWFYTDSNEKYLQTLEQLMGIYYYSVGRGANLLVNIGPDRRGLLPDIDVARIIEFGEEVRRRFSTPLATLENFNKKGNSLHCNLDKPTEINHLILSEDLSKGNLVRKYTIKCNLCGSLIPITLWQGEVIGHKAICYFPTIRAEELIVEVVLADPDYQIIKADVFCIDKQI